MVTPWDFVLQILLILRAVEYYNVQNIHINKLNPFTGDFTETVSNINGLFLFFSIKFIVKQVFEK